MTGEDWRAFHAKRLEGTARHLDEMVARRNEGITSRPVTNRDRTRVGILTEQANDIEREAADLRRAARWLRSRSGGRETTTATSHDPNLYVLTEHGTERAVDVDRRRRGHG
ncbi:hypothetical protein GCM10027416_11420 [Okibacterium endophyticum]